MTTAHVLPQSSKRCHQPIQEKRVLASCSVIMWSRPRAVWLSRTLTTSSANASIEEQLLRKQGSQFCSLSRGCKESACSPSLHFFLVCFGGKAAAFWVLGQVGLLSKKSYNLTFGSLAPR